jgi:hypothetical protein
MRSTPIARRLLRSSLPRPRAVGAARRLAGVGEWSDSDARSLVTSAGCVLGNITSAVANRHHRYPSRRTHAMTELRSRCDPVCDYWEVRLARGDTQRDRRRNAGSGFSLRVPGPDIKQQSGHKGQKIVPKVATCIDHVHGAPCPYGSDHSLSPADLATCGSPTPTGLASFHQKPPERATPEVSTYRQYSGKLG